MSGRGRYRGNRNREHGHGQQTLSSVAKETAASLPADSPVLAMFKAAAAKLNDRHDRHERLVKLSRDITIESKRIIFLLHSAIRKEDQKKAIIEAEDRLNNLIKGPIKTIGLELENRPAYLHSRAVSPGFQEFIEAYTLFYLLKMKEMVTWSEVQKQLQYIITEKPENESEEPVEREVVTLLTQNDYMLGIADLTGELMRRAINSISSGESEECFHSCQVVRDLYTGYLGIHNYGKELSRKLPTTRTNVHKVEAAVYALRVRGGEAPAPLLLGAGAPAPHEWAGEGAGAGSDDEGFY